MDVHTYIEDRLTKSAEYALTKQDQKIIDAQGIEEFIVRKLLSKKFRKFALPEGVESMIREQVQYCVSSNKPIQLSLSYGGFKLWKLPTAPEVDWSEFFYIAYHLKYMAPIAAAYEPGIALDFSSGDIAVTSVNNVPRVDVDQYYDSLSTLLATFEPHLPSNISLSASRLRGLFESEEEFLEEGEKLRGTAREHFANDAHLADEFERGAIQNVQLVEGNDDLSNATEEKLAVFRARAAEVIYAMYMTPQISGADRKGTINLMATNISLPIPMITTGGTKYSTAKFWAGLGVIARKGDEFADYILTPKQWESLKEQEHETIPFDTIPLKNFKELLVYPKKFEF